MDVTVEDLSVRLSLSITVWLPDKASKELAEHEEAHRAIAERFYADAEKVARPMAQKWVGKKLTGEGRDHHGAILRAATQLAESGALLPRLDARTFSLDQVEDAQRLVAERKAEGKVVVTVG